MNSIIAFVTAIGLRKNNNSEVPEFKPRWWYNADKLDGRPVAWSLRNHPEEWQWGETGSQYTIKHVPSSHYFWIANGSMFFRLYSTDCSCTRNERGFQLFHKAICWRAFKSWRRLNNIAPNEQFKSHFIH